MSARWLLPALVGLTLALLMLPFQVLILDDWVQLEALSQGSWELFRFADPASNPAAVVAGDLPWFSHPDLELAFMRPLSAALHALDLWLFGHGTLGRGLHSALWYAALCGVATALYRRVLPAELAFAAALLFATCGPHAQPVVWFAARNALIAGTLGGLALLAHLHRGAWRYSIAPIALAAALSAGEAGLGAAGLIAAHALVVDRGTKRILALLPSVVVVGGWLAVHVALGYGVAHSGAYIDPLGEPLLFVTHAPARLAFAVSVLLAGLSSELWYLWPSGHAWLALLGVLASAPVLVWLGFTLKHLPEEERRPLLWLGAGAGLALVPVLAGMLGSRSFLVPSLGTAPIVAVLIADPLRGGRLRRLRGVLAGLLVLGHVGFGLCMWGWVPYAVQVQHAETRRALDAIAKVDAHDTIVLLSAPSADVATYGAVHLRALGHEGPRLVPIRLGPGPVEARQAEGGVELQLSGWGEDPFHRLYRREPIRSGERVEADGVHIEVLGRRHDELHLRVEVAAEGEVHWWRWTEQGYRPAFEP